MKLKQTNAIELLLEVLGWLQIVAGTTAIAALVAFFVYIKGNNPTAIAFAIVSVGVITGAVWATIIWKRKGTVAWLSGIRRII